MIDHIGIRVSDLGTSVEFYTKALAPLGYALVMRNDEWGIAGFGIDGKPDFWISFQREATAKIEGIHVAFAASRRSIVDEFYQTAMAAGATDNGPPGPRPMYHENYYGGFVRDPDGHNIEAVCHEAYLG